MIGADDFYNVMCAMVPLYFAMFLAYGSVKWWKVFTPTQCSGINRFVAVFAVPVLSFHFISQNDPFQMDVRFLLADTLSKVFVLVALALPAVIFRCRLDWVITLFSVATLPNTLVMGIPLLEAMYGGFTRSLMVQLVVLQCIIWFVRLLVYPPSSLPAKVLIWLDIYLSMHNARRYTLLLFLFEYRAATILIRSNFPGEMAAAITDIEVDGDIISLDGRNQPLLTETDTDHNGNVHVHIRRSTSTVLESTSHSVDTSRHSNLSGAEIYSVNTRASSDAYSLQPTPRESNFEELDAADTPVWIKSPASTNSAGLKVFRPQYSPSNVVVVWEHGNRDHVVGDGNKAIESGGK